MPEGARLTNASPQLAGPILTDRNWELLDRFAAFAADRGHSMIELAFAWLLSQPEISSVIAGATQPEQIDANVAAGGWRLNAAEMAALAQLSVSD
jgi:aryl-alcohol dehydrogenase-like predicted oxidoreductase